MLIFNIKEIERRVNHHSYNFDFEVRANFESLYNETSHELHAEYIQKARIACL